MEIFLNARNSVGHLVTPTSQSFPHFKGRGIGTSLILGSCWHGQWNTYCVVPSLGTGNCSSVGLKLWLRPDLTRYLNA